MKRVSILSIMVSMLFLCACKTPDNQVVLSSTDVVQGTDTSVERIEEVSFVSSEVNEELNVEETVADDSTIEGSEGTIVNKCPLSASDKRKDVEYGEYSHETYFSNTAGRERGFSVLLPRNYDETKKYPVLYLLHGIFGDEYSFTNDPANKLKEIFYNLSEDGISRDWIVIMPSMYVKTEDSQAPNFSDPDSILPYNLILDELVNDIMPVVSERFPVLEGRDNTALAGFSLGGRQTLYISIKRPDLFAYACAISPAPGIVKARDWAMEHPGLFTEQEVVYPKEGEENAMKVLMITCGTSDKVVGQFPKSYHELLEKNGVDHIWYEVEGADHDNTAIKSGLYNFLVQVGK